MTYFVNGPRKGSEYDKLLIQLESDRLATDHESCPPSRASTIVPMDYDSELESRPSKLGIKIGFKIVSLKIGYNHCRSK